MQIFRFYIKTAPSETCERGQKSGTSNKIIITHFITIYVKFKVELCETDVTARSLNEKEIKFNVQFIL